MTVSAHTLVAPLRPACLGGGRLFVFLGLMQLTSLQLSFDGYGWVRMKDGPDFFSSSD